jgi:hypothetical protein
VQHIVVVGRLRLFEGTKHAGKENFGWFPVRRSACERPGPALPGIDALACGAFVGQCGASYRLSVPMPGSVRMPAGGRLIARE